MTDSTITNLKHEQTRGRMPHVSILPFCSNKGWKLLMKNKKFIHSLHSLLSPMKKFVLFVFFTFFSFLPLVTTVYAQDIGLEIGGKTLGQASGLGQTADAQTTVIQIINTVLGLLGIITIVLILYAGFKWMTSQGNEEEISSAQKIIKAAVLGLIIILSAYSITLFVFEKTRYATTSNQAQIF